MSVIVCAALSSLLYAAEPKARETRALLEMARENLAEFAEQITAGETTTRGRAKRIVDWYARHLDWTATDYEQRSVDAILARGGGNCDELARVATATMKAVGLEMRRVREINLHAEDDGRQERAAARVREHGARSSVFGRRHNDHVWVEIRDEQSDTWFPADPSLGIVGETEWTLARLGFGERFSVDPSSADMIAPFAIFATGPRGELIARTEHYVVNLFDEVHEGALQRLPSWKAWRETVRILEDSGRQAFEGRRSLHLDEEAILRARLVYEQLRAEYLDELRPGVR